MEDRSMQARRRDASPQARRDCAEAARRALIDAALIAYDDAGMSGLCAEGRWEATVDAMRSFDLATLDELRVDQSLSSTPTPTTALIASLSGAIAAVGGNSTPPPAGGSVAASVGALAAALIQMVAGLTHGRAKYAHVSEELTSIAHRAGILAAELTALVARDASVFEALANAYRQPTRTDESNSPRQLAIESALLPAAEVPLEIARTAAMVAELAATVAERGNTNATADAAVAAVIAESVCRASALTVRVNAAGFRDTARAVALRATATELTNNAARAAARAVTAAEPVIEGA